MSINEWKLGNESTEGQVWGFIERRGKGRREEGYAAWRKVRAEGGWVVVGLVCSGDLRDRQSLEAFLCTFEAYLLEAYLLHF